MVNAPKVSVIIPVYNAERYLRKCLESIMAQTLDDIEIICVDDGSDDKSLSILREYEKKDPRICIIAQANTGAGMARNAGLQRAGGEYLSFLDSDDYFEPEMLKAAYTAGIIARADICVYRCDMFDDETGSVYSGGWALKKEFLPTREPFDYRAFRNHVFQVFAGWTWDKLFRRDLIIKHDLRFQNLRTTNDMLFVFSAIVKAERILTLDDIFAHQRKRLSDSLSVTREESWHCFLGALNELEVFLREQGKYQELRRAFLNYALHFSLWNLNTLNGVAHINLYNELKHNYFIKWELLNCPENYFFSREEYGQFKRLMEMPFDLYIIDSMNRYRINYEMLRNQLETLGMKPVDEAGEALNAVMNSASFKIGRAVTYLPRKVAKFLGVS